MRMPGRNVSSAAPLSADETALRAELVADVQKLAGEIGERNMRHYPQLNAAADFIEASFSQAGLQPRRDTYELNGQACHNIEAEIRGARPEIVVIGAHYDSVFGSPGANDNGSGAAALLALARRFAGKQTGQTLRFVAFVNEEPFYFRSKQMGSFVYAGRCKARGDQISAMISLETIGYFSDAPGSQTYPAPGLGAVLSHAPGTSSDSWATLDRVRWCAAPSRPFGNRRSFPPKARPCPHSSPVSVGRINGPSGSTVIRES